MKKIGKKFFSAALLSAAVSTAYGATQQPNIILIMTDDQGWGETGYYNHPVLKTPNIDAMAKNGLRFDRFYAAAPVCSPTRASILTGRSPDRTGVIDHGYILNKAEKTLPEALLKAGYATAHIGKWHLNGLNGPGVPILADDQHNPGEYGFQRWLSTTNYFDIMPVMGRQNGKIEEFKGDSTQIIINETIDFIKDSVAAKKPFFAAVWDGSPHKPWVATGRDRAPFEKLDEESQHHYGELVAFDRGLGRLRKKLRDMDIEDNTILWFMSDNGGLPHVTPTTVAHLRGYKRFLWEGGIRVPSVIEYPGKIKQSVTQYPASTMDIFPTIVDLLNLPKNSMRATIDGESLVDVIREDKKVREKNIPFRYKNTAALIDNNMKLVATDLSHTIFLNCTT